MSDKEVADKIVNKALAKVRDRKLAPGAVSDRQKDDKAIHAIIQEWCGEGTIGVMRHKIVEYITTVRKEAREAAYKESAEFFCHWLLRAYEAIHRDTSYEEGENLDSVAREINQVIGFAGYEPESAARERLLAKRFSWNALHIEAAVNDGEGAENVDNA